jgi:hypothetical protein
MIKAREKAVFNVDGFFVPLSVTHVVSKHKASFEPELHLQMNFSRL